MWFPWWEINPPKIGERRSESWEERFRREWQEMQEMFKEKKDEPDDKLSVSVRQEMGPAPVHVGMEHEGETKGV